MYFPEYECYIRGFHTLKKNLTHCEMFYDISRQQFDHVFKIVTSLNRELKHTENDDMFKSGKLSVFVYYC